jgi:pimeloyl-ACP methyl ester carboxylesterase
MPANTGDSVRRTRGANGKLITARRSVARSGQHSELLEQPEEIVAGRFPGKLAASLPRPAAPRTAQRPQRRHTALTPTLPQIHAPVQIIAGARDTAVPPVNAEFLYQRLPHSTLDIIDAGHFTWEDAADEYAALVTSWWTGGYTATGPAAACDVGMTAMGEADQGA